MSRGLCKKCSSKNVESTCIGVIYGTRQDNYDANKHTCMDCGHVVLPKHQRINEPTTEKTK